MSAFAWLRRYWRPSSPPESSRSADGVGSPRRPSSSYDSLASTAARRLRRGLSSALLCVPLLAVLATGAAAQTEVPASWPLKPSGLSAGDQFRLMFITSTTRDATSTDIADYNNFVQGRAAAGHTSIRSYSAQFRALGSTAAVDARDNAMTTGTGVPIYWLGGAKVADNNADFHDGTWANPVGRDESGTSVASNTRYFTGSDNDGTRAFFSGSSLFVTLGASLGVRYGETQGLSRSSSSVVSDISSSYALLALSPVFEVGQPNQLSIDAKSYLVTEGGTVSVTLNLRNWGRLSATTVGITCTDGTAGSADYTCPATVTVPANTRSHTFTIQTTADTVDEFPETFTVAIGTVPTGVRKGTPSSATVTIVGGGFTRGNFHFKEWDGRTITIDNGDGTTSRLTEVDRIASSGHVREGGSLTYTVERGQKFGAASVDYETADGTAKAPGDYTHVSGTLNFAHGESSKTITIETVCDDVDHEGAEQFWLILSNPTGGYSLTSTNRYYPHRSRVVIGRVPVDECPTSSEQVLPGGTPPEVTVSADRTSVTEGGDVTFTVTANPAPAGDLVVNVAADEEMGSGGDLVAGGHSGTVTIWAGTASATWTVTTMSDDDALADGTVVGRIEAGDNYTVGAPSEVTVTLLDDDGVTTQSVPDSVVGVDPALVALVRGYAAETWKHPDHVKRWKRVLAAFGDDNGYTPMTAAEAQIHADKGWQRWVPVAAALAALEAAQQPLTLPAVSVSAGSDVTEGGDAVFTVTASPAPASPLSVSVTVATRGDYGIASGTQTVSIPTAGSATLTLTTTGDDTDEPDGSVSVTVAAGDGYTVGDPASGTVSIADDDLPPPAVSIAAKAASVTEGGAASFTLTTDRALDANLTVTLSVSEAAGSDHVAADDEGTATVVIAKGTTEAAFPVATVDDAVDEPDGSVTVTLKDGGGYTVSPSQGAAAVTVKDNDAAVGPVLSVDDATGQENGRLPVMPFTVRLSAPAQDAVRVYVSTRPSTPVSATPKVDYAPASSALTFRAGETEKQVWVLIYNDSHDEEPETFEVVLSKAQGAPIGDGVAVGTIVNDDPMPAAWLARFGRTVAEQALDGIAGRMAADRTPGMQGSIAGQALSFDPAANDNAAPDHMAAGSPASDGTDALALADVAQAFGGHSGHSGPGGFGHDAAGFANGTQSRTMTAREALLGSSFSLTGATDGSGGSMAFWGRAAQARFDGREGTFSLDGTVTTGMLGADYARAEWLVGLALAQSEGEGDYRDTGIAPRPASQPCPDGVDGSLCNGAVRAGDGTVEASLTAAIPYAALQASERLKLWGAAGYGTGEVTLKTALGGSYKADTSWSMAAAGLRGDLLAPPAEGGPALAVTSDALWTRSSSEKTDQLAASDSGATRLRLGLEGSYRMALEGGGSLVPKLEIGARHDGGDAETGFGVEIGGGIAWSDPALGLSLDVSGRTLIAHGNDDLKDRGYAASLGFDPDPASGRGPSLSLRQEFGGQATGGLDALFQPAMLEDRAGSEAASRWTLEAAWGLPALGERWTGSPHAGLGLATGARDYSLGWRLTPEADAPDLSFSVRATRSENDWTAPEHAVGFGITVRW